MDDEQKKVERLIMDNKQAQVEKPFYQKGWFFITLTVSFVLILVGNTMTNNSPYPPPPPPPPPVHETNKLNFKEITQIDQTRMKNIFMGVMQNTISVTPNLKSELRNIFTKYNTTDEEINDFATYGPTFLANYQRLFFTDALQAISSEVPVKSYERLNLEKEAISRGLMTFERAEANDSEMKLIASHQPVIGSDGRQIIFTAAIISSTLNNINSITARLKSLLE